MRNTQRFFYRPQEGTEERIWLVYAADPKGGVESLGTAERLMKRRWRVRPAEGSEPFTMQSRQDSGVMLWSRASPELRERSKGRA